MHVCVYCRVPPVNRRLVWSILNLHCPLSLIPQWALRLSISQVLDQQHWKAKVFQDWRERKVGQRCNERKSLVQEMRGRWACLSNNASYTYWMLLTLLYFFCHQSPPKPAENPQTEELNFEFDDDLELGGKKHRFSEQPWYALLPPPITIIPLH